MDLQVQARGDGSAPQDHARYEYASVLARGQTDAKLLLDFKRVSAFSYSDIHILRDLLKPFTAHVTTPHILAETSNFVDQAPQYKQAQVIGELRRYIDTVAELYRPAQMLAQRGEFAALGLTDTGIAELSSGVVVLTTDYHLSGKIDALGGHALNFNHSRSRASAG